MINSLGSFHVDKAFSGIQAIKFVSATTQARQQYDLIFMDINMPEMDGF